MLAYIKARTLAYVVVLLPAATQNLYRVRGFAASLSGQVLHFQTTLIILFYVPGCHTETATPKVNYF